jgi:hypothetical protein
LEAIVRSPGHTQGNVVSAAPPPVLDDAARSD